VDVGERLRVDVRTGADRIVLELHGELDLAGAPALGEQIRRAEAQDDRAVVLDLEDLQFLDSAGLRVILAAHERAQEEQRELAITPGTPQVQRLLSVAGVSDYLRTVSSPDGALTGRPGAR
jgi:anti-anti-sigma factor